MEYNTVTLPRYKPKPIVTYFLIFLNIVIWILMTLSGGSTNADVLIKFGAKVNSLIAEGEYWRLLTPIFLHVGIMHLLFNCYALYNIGPIVELLFGKVKYAVIYVLAGIGGSLLSFAFTPNISAGASGAIFGLMGALLYFGISKKQIFRRVFGINLYLIIAINLFIGFTTDGIDNFGHIGGLIAGFLAAATVGLKGHKKFVRSIVFLVITFAVLYATFTFALNRNQYYIIFDKAVQSYQQGDYQQAEIYAKYILDKYPDNIDAKYILGITYYAQNDIQKAKNEMIHITQIDEKYAPAYYILGLIYLQDNDVQNAKKYLKIALEYNPEMTEAQQILDNLE